MTNVRFDNVKISAIKCIVPQNIINISDEIEYFDNSEKKLNRAKKILGYGTRHVVDDKTTASDLVYEAGKELIEKLNIDKDSIDCLLFMSQCRDYVSPTTANVLHGLLDLNENCAVMDISQGCSGYVYALWLASSIIQSGSAKKILLLTGDTFSKYSYQSNRLIAPIFGDSGSATMIEYTDSIVNSYFVLGSKGKDWDKIIVPASGARLPIDNEILNTDITDASNNKWNLSHLIMNGIDVFNFTIEYVPKSIAETLGFAKVLKEDIELFGLHQANKQIIESIAEKLEIPKEKIPSNTFNKFGNCTCNSIALVLAQNLSETNCENVLLSGFGVGMSWASAIINIGGVKNLGISLYEDTKNTPTREELKKYWINRFKTKGE